MGRHFEVRAKSMAATAAKKSALYMRASKEIYIAAKSGVPDPNSNLALRSAIDKWKGQSVPKDIIDRAIKKAIGGEIENYIEGRYEAFGPGGSFVVVDTLSDNVNRALSDVRTVISKKGGHLGS
ncbi:MAG: YebC/PmpR family DNA-binding transcriptional regulator, partial [Erysipelotrichia bacterium]|nr:YebC/PmpR family DNA-binding transcriptional regulator [Erysipelotrichia bacterium]